MERTTDARKFRIVVCTYPDKSLAPAAELLKAAVLYGDEVLLHSPSAILTASLASISGMDAGDLVDTLREWAPALGESGAAFEDRVRQLESDHGAPRARALLEQFIGDNSGEMAVLRRELDRVVEGELENADVPSVLPAIEAGLLKLLPIEKGDLFDEYMKALWSVLLDSRYYPLFDDRMAGLVKAAVDVGVVNPSSHMRARGRQAGAASGFLARLPTFPRASMDEVVDIRSELDRPLVRFRGEMVNIASNLDTEVFDPDFDEAAEEAWKSKVHPALLELEDLVNEKKLRTQFSIKVPASGVVGAMGGLVTGLITHAPLVSAGMGTSAAAIALATGVASERAKLQRDIAKRPYYFLHRAEELLTTSVADAEGTKRVFFDRYPATHDATEDEVPKFGSMRDAKAPHARIQRSEYGDEWPFTVESGTLHCHGTAVVFETDEGMSYALNGTALSQTGLPRVDAIWLDDPAVPGLKKSLGRIIDLGLRLRG